MTMLARAGLGLLALFACLAAMPAAAAVTQLPQCMNAGAQYVPCQGVVLLNPDGSAAAPTAAATSTPLTFTDTTTTTHGPWPLQYARDIYIAFAITGGTASINVVATTDGVCADGYQLSAANTTYIRGAFSNVAAGRYREDIGQETQSGAQLCVTVVPSAGASVVGGLSQ
jgi:hypothetical protein